MREIKFRAWDEYSKSMYRGVVYSKDEESGVRPWVFMQYTGLIDKNGKEIFESDEVQFEYEEDMHDGTFQGVVQWDDDGYWEIDIHDEGFLTAIFSDKIQGIEIIGNIYENPEPPEKK